MSASTPLASVLEAKKRRRKAVHPSKVAWEFKCFTLVKEVKDGSHWFQCNFCKENPTYQAMQSPPGLFRGTRIRLRSHIFSVGRHSVSGCKSITNDELHDIRKKALYECRLLGLRTDEELVNMRKGCQLTSPSGSDSVGTTASSYVQSSINFNPASTERLDEAIGKFIFYGGLPLSVVKNPYFKAMLEAAKLNRGPISVPSIDNLRTLVEKLKATSEERVRDMTKASGAVKLEVTQCGLMCEDV